MKRYLLDLDGTLYRGGEPIEHAAQFIESLSARAGSYLLVTNCPLRAPRAIEERLRAMGIPVREGSVLTSAEACRDYLLARHAGARVHLLGSDSFRALLRGAGVRLVERGADVALLGYDDALDYDKLCRFCDDVRGGAVYLASNPDPVIPGGCGLVPHTGAVAAAVRCAAGREPLYIGKPAETMLISALARLGCAREDCVVVGDRLDTDILFGQRAGLDTVLVLTGTTTPAQAREAVENGPVRPGRVVRDLGELLEQEGERGNV